MVHLVQVNVICPQPPQAVLTGLAYVVRRQAALVHALAHFDKYPGRQDDQVAPPILRQPAPWDLRRESQVKMRGVAVGGEDAIGIGRVDEVNPLLQGVVHDGEAVGLAGLRSEVHCAQAQPTDLQARTARGWYRIVFLLT